MNEHAASIDGFFKAGFNAAHLDLGDWERHQYRDVASDLAKSITEAGRVCTSLEPGNGSRYELMIAEMASAPHQLWAGGAYVAEGFLVAALNFGVARIFRAGYTDPSYISEKFGWGRSDSTVLAALLNSLWEALDR